MKHYSEGEVYKALVERLNAHRSVTQASIAKELGFTAQYLNDVIGKRRPVSENLANALGFKELPRAFVRFKAGDREEAA